MEQTPSPEECRKEFVNSLTKKVNDIPENFKFSLLSEQQLYQVDRVVDYFIDCLNSILE